jgi:hypothetical protein
MVIVEDESGIDNVRERSVTVLADFHCLFKTPTFQGSLDSRHKFRSFSPGSSSVIKDPFQKNGDGQKRAEEQDIHRETTDLNNFPDCFSCKHLIPPSGNTSSSNNITHPLGFGKRYRQWLL